MTKSAGADTTSMQWAQMVVQVILDACDVDQECLFKEADLDMTSWMSLSRVTQEDLTSLWKAADRLGGPPDIGLGVLKKFHFRTVGSLAFKMMVATTFRQSILEANHQISLVSDVWRFSLAEERGQGVMRFRLVNPAVDVTHHSYDAFISACTRLVRDCFPTENYSFSEIWFARPDLGMKKRYEQALGCHCRFDASEYALCMDARLLDIPLSSSDPQLYETLDYRLDHETRHLNSLSAHIEKTILGLIDQGVTPSRSAVASSLEVGERTLLRRLKDENLTFKELQEQVFETLAVRSLQQGDSMESIAERFGYADATSFRKMLRRRTGMSVRALRSSPIKH
ncbi:HTH-type transcriptional regulator VirS [Zhongshania aliphaticivorans]|uniref:HTH-type transcriptional regulator VirS n=1 Tax=Zhongshania aliphaticivorans TaxID=1470434 RepID=A0A5S9MVC7_9GAMM|nr:AraC family transcriptional regulator [Zhongshania aliphaticivorans]CAA0080250.1 HTH-type transcriptional regulator VirS [Zhongshania aliphaticivorans]CAA0085763.1 HTH-type transcriptional regulator VirS [Zhongshania aliphaticivorans]